MAELRAPTDQQRTVVLGRTGSGKSQFSIALLSTRNWANDRISKQPAIPWIIIDYKGEDLIADILAVNKGQVKFLTPKDKAPKEPGLYYMRPLPLVDDDEVDLFLWRVHKQGNCGLFIDEGYALPQKKAFDVILTQGRSLHIPVICLYQRPVWMSRFAVAQADFFAVFEQNDERDLKVAKQFVRPAITEKGEIISVFSDLPPYYCLWYDVAQGRSTVLRPAPDRQTIIDTFTRRLKPTRSRALI